MMNYWNNLNERERWIAAMGFIATLFYLIYLLIYDPLTTSIHQKTKLLTEQEQTLAWMQTVRTQPSGNQSVKTISGSQLLTLIATELSTPLFKKFPHQLQQTNQGEIELTFDKVPYPAFLNWLWGLGNHYSIFIKQLTIEHTDIPGIVKTMIIIVPH